MGHFSISVASPFRRIWVCSLALALGWCCALAPTALANSTFHWDFINVDIEVLPNGDMRVQETQRYAFNAATSSQRYRYIPLNRVDQIEFESVRLRESVLPSQVRRENNRLYIQWRQPVNPPQTQTFVLTYRVIGGLHVNSQNTQVYWKAIFADRVAPVKAAKVTVHLPEALAGQVSSFRSFGVPATARQVNATTFEFVPQGSIPPRQELEVQVTFPTAVLQVPTPQWQSSSWFRTFWAWMPWSLFVPGVVLWQLVSELFKRRCPQCHQFKLQRTYTVLVKPTKLRSGSQRVDYLCHNCNHTYSLFKELPSLSDGGSGGGGGG